MPVSGSGGMGGMASTPDPQECETALTYKEMFIFDIQTHRVERANATYRRVEPFHPERSWVSELETIRSWIAEGAPHEP